MNEVNQMYKNEFPKYSWLTSTAFDGSCDIFFLLNGTPKSHVLRTCEIKIRLGNGRAAVVKKNSSSVITSTGIVSTKPLWEWVVKKGMRIPRRQR
jgi:hypothetical protein